MSADGPTVASALADLERSPLSRKRAMLLALLIDRAVDEEAGPDPLAHRRRVAAGDLGIVLALSAMREDGPRLVLDAVRLEDPRTVSEADYMVSVYNGATVPRIRVAWPDGRREDALPILRRAAGTLASSATRRP